MHHFHHFRLWSAFPQKEVDPHSPKWWDIMPYAIDERNRTRWKDQRPICKVDGLLSLWWFHGWWQEGSAESCHQGVTSDVWFLPVPLLLLHHPSRQRQVQITYKNPGENGKFICNPQMQCTASAGIRTRDLLITERARYRLSHHITLNS